MLYPGYTPREKFEPILLHYGLPITVGNWSFSKLEHHEDAIVYDCGRLFPQPPYPKEVREQACHIQDEVLCYFPFLFPLFFYLINSFKISALILSRKR